MVTVYVDEEWKNSVKQSLPELPQEKFNRFRQEYGIPEYDAEVLTQSRGIAAYFEETCSKVKKESYKTASNWVMTEVMRVLNDRKISIEEFNVSAANLAALVNMIAGGSISNNIAKEVYTAMLLSEGKDDPKQDPSIIVKEKNLLQVSDSSEIESIIKKVISENPKETERYKSGETKLLGFFVGKVMKESKGKANPKVANELVIKHLG